MQDGKIKPFRSTGQNITGTTVWEKIWSPRKYNFEVIVPVLYANGGPAVARFEFTFDDDLDIENGTPKFEHWEQGNVNLDDTVSPPLVANDVLPAPTGFRVVVISGAVDYVVAGR